MKNAAGSNRERKQKPWRHLSLFTDDPEVMAALPSWARESLQEHAKDPRPKILDPEALARSQTGDVLWDLAQTSLRIHGELHNNLRMTWAKAIIPWRPDPEAALATLIDLNHRFALDGSDPNSYGGLLWTLGLFDRPFPDSPVTGSCGADPQGPTNAGWIWTATAGGSPSRTQVASCA